MKRNIVTSVLLMFFTLGIYSIYLLYRLSIEVDEITNEDKNNEVIDVVLSIFTFGLYTIYWFYKIGRQLETYQEDLQMNRYPVGILTAIIAFIPYYGGMISMAMIQHEINRIIDEKVNF